VIAMAHMKRYVMPGFWPVRKKERKWVARPKPGPHPLKNCMTLQTVLKNVLGYAGGSREARKIIRAGKILVDRKERKEHRFPIGLMDTIEIPDTGEAFRVMLDKNGLRLEKINKEQAGEKLCRIRGKKTLKGGVFQIGLHDGKNILIKGKPAYNVGDSLLVSLPDQKILKHFKLEKGADALVVAGTSIGMSGKISGIKDSDSMLKKSTVTLEADGKKIETLKDYILVGSLGGGK